MAKNASAYFVNVSIERSAHDTYEYLFHPENSPKWATTFCKAIRKEGDKWIAKTSHRNVSVRFVEGNSMGVLDLYVTTETGTEIYVPTRVVPNGAGSEVMLTVFHPPDMPADGVEKLVRLVKADLMTLKEELEKDASQ